MPDTRLVTVAVVTSHLGVLIGKRSDGTPPWVFPGGTVEPGESPADTAVREVHEETGLWVNAGEEVTGVEMVYVAAEPDRGTDVRPVAGEGLAEVRWANLVTALELLPSMFSPVRRHLERVLGR